MKNILKKSIGVLLILITVFCIFSGCVITDNQEQENDQNNSVPSGGGCETSWLTIKFHNEQEKCDIDDVRISVSYGGAFYSEAMAENYRNHSIDYPSFDLYIVDDNYNQYLIRHVDENLVSTKYSYAPDYENDTPIEDRIFNHTETVTIPEEAFTQSNGYILFSVYGKNMHSTNSKYGLISEIAIYYKIEENKVVLSSTKIK